MSEDYRAKFHMEQAKAQRDLYRLMAHLSEEYFFAGWLMGLEHILWSVATGDGRCKWTTAAMLREREGPRLMELATAAGVWYAWDEKEAFAMPVKLADWKPIYEATADKAWEV